MNMLSVVGSNGNQLLNNHGTIFSELHLNNHQQIMFWVTELLLFGLVHQKEVFYISQLTHTQIWLEEEMSIIGRTYNIRIDILNGSLFTLDILK